MLGLLWLIPVLPFAGFLILVLFGPRLSRRTSAMVGVGSVALATLVALLVAIGFAAGGGQPFRQVLWTWMRVDNFSPAIGFYLDQMSLLFVLVVTFVGTLIHLYSIEYMADDEAFSRFFAYMNLFVGSMLTLVLADNLLLLYLGWEGVGLCSYLLIGFWYTDPSNGYAARKAFVVTRVGDTAMAIGLFLLFTDLGTLTIQELLSKAPGVWPVGSSLAVASAAMLLGGALGKSAQIPLQTWLPDAMAGPTPTSALIHAATMVTAGVYLIARTHVIFSLAPSVMLAVAILGALTLLVAGCAALVQTDIKRTLAYSTISQIGYMFLALGVGAWSAAIFHFMTHAFFKALLFLGAGAVILAVHHEQEMSKMGGLRRHLPLVFWTFLIGSASLAALPLVTAGFYSKDLIIWDSFAAQGGSMWLWLAALVGAFLTALYTFRMVFLTFFGEPKWQHLTHEPGQAFKIALVVLAVLSIVAGFVEVPGVTSMFSDYLHTALPPTVLNPAREGLELPFTLVSAIITLVGIYLAYLFFLRSPRLARGISNSAMGNTLARWWKTDWGFDWLYDRLFVWPVVWFARVNKNDFADWIRRGIAIINVWLNRLLSQTETGQLRWYVATIALGAIVSWWRWLWPYVEHLAEVRTMLLALLVFWFILGAIIAWATGRLGRDVPRWITLIALLIHMLGLIVLWLQYPAQVAAAHGRWVMELNLPWIPQWGISFYLALDGVSLLLILLSSFLGIMAVAASWSGIQYRIGFFHFNLMWILAAIVGIFLAEDLFLFYFFWEMMLIPLYFLIGIWGHERRVYATLKFFIFTQASSLFMLISIIGLYIIHGKATGTYTFNYNQLLGTSMAPTTAFWLMLGFFIAFGVKLPLFPLHTWLPDAHTEAPTAGSVDLAGLVLKVGAYGFLRFLIPLFPQAAFSIAPIAMALAVIGILYGAIVAYGQTDLKRLVAYTSVSHMGFVLLGIFAWNQLALQGAMMVMLAHGVTTGALFILVGDMGDRMHSRDITRMGGLWPVVPRIAGFSQFFAVATLGLPGLGNFVGEILVLMGAWRVSPLLTIIATFGFIFSTVYALWMIQAAFLGKNVHNWQLPASTPREVGIMVVLLLTIVWLGLYPQPMLNTAERALQQLQQETPRPASGIAAAQGVEQIVPKR